MMTDFTIIKRSLRLRLFSTLITALTVAVAVCLMLVLLSLRDASRSAFNRGSGNIQLLLSADSSPMVSVLNAIFYANPPARAVKWPACQELLAKYPVDFAIPIQQGDSYRSFPILATTTQFFSAFQPNGDEKWKLADGEFFKAEFQIVAGASVAKVLGLKTGDSFFITHGISGINDTNEEERASGGDFPTMKAALAQMHRYSKYKIVGVLQPTGTSHDRALFTDLNSAWIVHAHEKRKLKDPTVTQTTAADLAASDQLITGVYVRFKTAPGSSESPALYTAYDDLKRHHPELTVALPGNEIDKLFTIVSNIDEVFVAMAAVVMLSSGIAILLALYNSMEQRRRQVAVLRVLGCSQVRIFGLVITEAALIGVFGALGGLVLSVMVNQIAARILDAKLGLALQPALLGTPTVLILFAAVVLASFAGIIPAVLAYRTTITRSLRPLG